MNQPMDDNEVRRYVEAFADGELDVEQSLRLLERMAMDPQTTKRVLHQQQLRQRTARVMGEPGQAPAELRQQLEQMAQSTPAPGEMAPTAHRSDQRRRRARRGVVARIGRWTPAAAAAVLLITTISIIGLNQQANPTPPPTQSNSLLTSSQVDRFERRHVRCSQGVDPMMKPWLFPDHVTKLPGALTDYFDRPMQVGALDLSVLGYDYVEAGECRVPGRGAVHVLYRAAAGSDRSDTLSLWMRREDDQLDLEPGRLYVAAGDESPHPLVIWKRGGMVYYLAGDALERVQRVASHLRGEDGAHG